MQRARMRVRVPEAELAQLLLLDHRHSPLRCHDLEHLAHLRHVVAPTDLPQHAWPQPTGVTASGWSPKPGNIKKVAEVLKNLNLKPCDTIVIDAMANSAYFGTDENGLPMPPAKSGEDGRHHMIGDLQLAPTAVF
jgi:hypothetical protein